MFVMQGEKIQSILKAPSKQDLPFFCPGTALSVWILECSELTEQESMQVAKAAELCTEVILADYYQSVLFLFLKDSGDRLLLQKDLEGVLPVGVVPAVFYHIRTAGDVQHAWFLFPNSAAAKLILPQQTCLMADDLEFARMCQQILAAGNSEKEIKCLTEPLAEKGDVTDLLETVTAYLLDCQRSVQKTAEMLFVHRNTIKYRLKSVSERFGFPVGQMPASYRIYLAAALRRLKNAESTAAEK